jgi:hypothetical protein
MCYVQVKMAAAAQVVRPACPKCGPRADPIDIKVGVDKRALLYQLFAAQTKIPYLWDKGDCHHQTDSYFGGRLVVDVMADQIDPTEYDRRAQEPGLCAKIVTKLKSGELKTTPVMCFICFQNFGDKCIQHKQQWLCVSCKDWCGVFLELLSKPHIFDVV